MLDTATKRRIDSARDILVGKVPDPKSQVEQITIALIYKFMDDMDAEAEELGGKRSFFANDFARYGWAKLMRSGLGGHEMLGLYAEAIARMPENPGIPPLFRDIFKNAYLPYRDPETLRAFLKIIDDFEYDHSERLGGAYEYLLSVLGSQGDAGQFRTPRHIIDFIVSIVDPKKGETILDPACGTAGFHISAWKHITAANRDEYGESLLSPDEHERLAAGITGYDISPDMVRLSLANMYLHGFTDPHIVEYDTLTSDERWNEFADVILANPPFMSPKGGIRPHNRFGVQSNRSEVLFVDYMAEHLSPDGRAGIIVPEGVIFQSGKAYKALRKELVEHYLVAVISLPSGVFQPYSGVKTSVLILDKSAARLGRKILFSVVTDIGMSLGIKRSKVERNNLPTVLADFRANSEADLSEISWLADREEIARRGWNLSAALYRPRNGDDSVPIVSLGEICNITKGTASSTKTEPGDYPLILTAATPGSSGTYQFDGPHVCVPLISSTGHGRASIKRIHYADGKFALANLLAAIAPKDSDRLLPEYLYFVLDGCKDSLAALMQGAANVGMKPTDLEQFTIPVPPPEMQREIVTEIKGYRNVIDGARAVVENYRPHFVIDRKWPIASLGEACQIQRGKFSHRPRNEPRFYGGQYPFIQTGDVVRSRGRAVTYTQTLNAEGLSVSKLFQPPVVLVTIAANIGDTAVLDFPACFPDSVVGLIPNDDVDARFLELAMRDQQQFLNDIAPQAAQKNINIEILKTVKLSLPPLETQREIVAELEAERALVEANRELIARMEKKIEAAIARVWGAAEPEAVELVLAAE